MANPDRGKDTVYGDKESAVITTTAGRVVFSEIWPEEIGFPNFEVAKGKLGELIGNSYKFAGQKRTVVALDKLKELGFKEATKAGASIGVDDMIIPAEKSQQIKSAQKEIDDVEKQYRKGVITPGERYNKIIDIWTHATDKISNVMLETLRPTRARTSTIPLRSWWILVHVVTASRCVSSPVCVA